MIPWSNFLRLSAVLVLGAFCCFLTASRLASRGTWLPELPVSFGIWQSQEVPIDEETLSQLGHPRTLGREFRNPLDDRVYLQVIATASFDAYQIPRIFSLGYMETATRLLPILEGRQRVLAQIFKQGATDTRVLMYTWIQSDSGMVSVEGAMPGVQRSFTSRLALGLRSVLDREQSCVVRFYAVIPPTDTLGVQTRRNLNEVVGAFYRFTRPGGRG